MAYQDDIKTSVKVRLNLDASDDAYLDSIIPASVSIVLGYCKRLESEIDTEISLQEAIIYNVIIQYNRRFNEGIKNTSVAGFSTTYELEKHYNMLIALNRKIGVI